MTLTDMVTVTLGVNRPFATALFIICPERKIYLLTFRHLSQVFMLWFSLILLQCVRTGQFHVRHTRSVSGVLILITAIDSLRHLNVTHIICNTLDLKYNIEHKNYQ